MSLYAEAGVDTAAGDRAVDLMRAAVTATHGPEVLGGLGGFAGMFDASALKGMSRPVLATSTDGVGTKVAIAQRLGVHTTIGQDLVGMVVDDIVVVGARPLFMTDYIACGKVVPERTAELVGSIAGACTETGAALVGGEVAEHPDLLGPDEYDLAGAAVGVVEYERRLDPSRVREGDILFALPSSGLHSNGYSLVRHVVARSGVDYDAAVPELERPLGLELLEPTRLYSAPVMAVLESPSRDALHMLSHITGGGIAANLSRVLPAGSWAEVHREAWSPLPVFRALARLGGFELEQVEDTWNLGLGMVAVVDPAGVDAVAATLTEAGVPGFPIGTVHCSERDLDGFTVGAKGVSAGAVRLVGEYAEG